MLAYTRWAYLGICLMLTPALIQAQDLPVNTESAGARAHFIMGMAALDANRFDDARNHFDNALAYDADFAAAHLYRTWTARSGADWKAHHEKAKANREGASAYIQNLIDQSVAGTSNDAEKQLELSYALVMHYPASARAHTYLATELSGHKKIQQERATLRTAMALDKTYAPAYRAMALSYIFEEPKDLEKAAKYAKKYSKLAAAEADAYIVLGDAKRAMNDFEGARNAYASAIEVNPENQVSHSKRGHANTFLGDYEAARADFEAAAAVSGSLGGKVGNQQFGAYTHLYAGDVDGAMQALGEILMGVENAGAPEDEKIFPAMGLHQQMALIAMHNGRHDVARDHFAKRAQLVEKAIVQIQEPGWAQQQRAIVKLFDGLNAAYKGDLVLARKIADEHKALVADQKNDRRFEGYHRLMGVIEMKGGNHAAAMKHFSQANDQNPMVVYENAMAHELGGKKQEAMALYGEVAQYNFNSVNTAICRNMAREKTRTM